MDVAAEEAKGSELDGDGAVGEATWGQSGVSSVGARKKSRRANQDSRLCLVELLVVVVEDAGAVGVEAEEVAVGESLDEPKEEGGDED